MPAAASSQQHSPTICSFRPAFSPPSARRGCSIRSRRVRSGGDACACALPAIKQIQGASYEDRHSREGRAAQARRTPKFARRGRQRPCGVRGTVSRMKKKYATVEGLRIVRAGLDACKVVVQKPAVLDFTPQTLTAGRDGKATNRANLKPGQTTDLVCIVRRAAYTYKNLETDQKPRNSRPPFLYVCVKEMHVLR